jgi:hypothetical protein
LPPASTKPISPKVAGPTVETMISVYTHALDRGHEQIRGIIG